MKGLLVPGNVTVKNGGFLHVKGAIRHDPEGFIAGADISLDGVTMEVNGDLVYGGEISCLDETSHFACDKC